MLLRWRSLCWLLRAVYPRMDFVFVILIEGEDAVQWSKRWPGRVYVSCQCSNNRRSGFEEKSGVSMACTRTVFDIDGKHAQRLLRKEGWYSGDTKTDDLFDVGANTPTKIPSIGVCLVVPSHARLLFTTLNILNIFHHVRTQDRRQLPQGRHFPVRTRTRVFQ